jgi:hypothetical protein
MPDCWGVSMCDSETPRPQIGVRACRRNHLWLNSLEDEDGAAQSGTPLASRSVMSEVTQPLKALDLALVAPSLPRLGFDTARLAADGREAEWTAEKFKEIPLVERIRMLSAGQVRFFRQGSEIPAREALREL